MDNKEKRQISIVVPVYNEEESLLDLFREFESVLPGMGLSYEIIFVNDGSSDNSPQLLSALERENPGTVRVMTFAQRNGQTAAMKAGLNAAQGEIVVTMDADLQNDPADIPFLILKLQGVFDCVCGWRRDRQDKPLKAMLSKTGNVLQRSLTGLNVHDTSCTLRAYRAPCAEHIVLERDGQHRFIPLSLSLQGFRVGEILAHHRGRRYGYSKYSHKRIGKVIVDFFRVLMTRGRG